MNGLVKKEKRKKKGRKNKIGKNKENCIELQKHDVEAEVYNNNKKCDWIYTYTPLSKIKTVQQKQSTIDWPGEQRKQNIISIRTKLTRAQAGKQTEERWQLGNKVMKIKLTNMLRGN